MQFPSWFLLFLCLSSGDLSLWSAEGGLLQSLEAALGIFFQKAGNHSFESKAKSLPDFQATFLTAGSFLATSGYFYTGFNIEKKIQASIADNTVSVEVPLSLRDFVAGYNKYSIQVGGVKAEGSVRVTAGESRLRAKLAYDRDPSECHLRLSEFSLSWLGELELASEHLDSFGPAVLVLSDWLLEELQPQLLATLQLGMRGLIVEVATEHGKTFCPLFHSVLRKCEPGPSLEISLLKSQGENGTGTVWIHCCKLYRGGEQRLHHPASQASGNTAPFCSFNSGSQFRDADYSDESNTTEVYYFISGALKIISCVLFE